MVQQIDWQVELIDRPPEDCQIISSYGLYVSLIAFWVGFESLKLKK